MSGPLAIVTLAGVQLVQASLIVLATTLILRRVCLGSAAVRWRIAAWSFYGAALLPLAFRLNGSLRISFGPEARHILSARAPELPTTGGWMEAAAAAVLAVLVLGIILRLAMTLRAVVAGERLAAGAVRTVDPASGREIGISAEVAGPLVAGLARPTVILPPALLALPAGELRPILEHEFAHVRRGDVRGALVQRLVEDFLWWNPAIAVLGRRLSHERELACDEVAAAQAGRLAFGFALLRQARRSLAAGPQPALAVGALGTSRLGWRIDRLTEPIRPVPTIAVVGLVALMTGAAVCTPRAPDTGATHTHIASS